VASLTFPKEGLQQKETRPEAGARCMDVIIPHKIEQETEKGHSHLASQILPLKSNLEKREATTAPICDPASQQVEWILHQGA